jgi:hypothetical protein
MHILLHQIGTFGTCREEMLHTKLLSLLEDEDIHNYR